MSTAGKTREFTGWHMLAIMVSFFSVIITVNLTMAFLASSSWTGFVVENTYVASQKFNQKAAEGRAQAALGWTSEFAVADGRISYRLTDKAGNVVAAKHGTANFRRPAYAAEDLSVTLAPEPDGALVAPVAAHDGLWIVEVDIDVDSLPRPYRDVRRVTLRDGRLQ